METKSIIVWFLQDLRLSDNPALSAAAPKNIVVIPVFIWSPEEEGSWTPGAASRWWLHQSLKRLDAAPYFRIFNPILQGEKFGPDGVRIRRWIPEIKELPRKFVLKPWQASRDILKVAKVNSGEIYPFPLVNHHEARNRALLA